METWKQFFYDNPEYDQLYEAIRDRLEAEQNGEVVDFQDIEAEVIDQTERENQELADEHYCKYERCEYFRKRHANANGYPFKPKLYNPNEKY